jgi:hydroxymethylglutaryl-CoA reductase
MAGSFYVQGRCFQIKLVFAQHKTNFFQKLNRLPQICKKRGGGILDIILKDKTDLLPNYFQLHATFETKDSMGNFINSCLNNFLKHKKQKHTIIRCSQKRKRD